MGHEISEKEEKSEKQIQGKSWYRKTKNVQFVELMFCRFLSLAHVHFTSAHTQYMDGRAFLTYRDLITQAFKVYLWSLNWALIDSWRGVSALPLKCRGFSYPLTMCIMIVLRLWLIAWYISRIHSGMHREAKMLEFSLLKMRKVIFGKLTVWRW